MRWADDGWRGHDGVLGGDLVDLTHPWAGRDKVVHLVLFYLLWMALALIPDRLLLRLVLWHTISFGVEALEWLGASLKWSWFADRPSWRDLVTNEVGLGIAALHLRLLLAINST